MTDHPADSPQSPRPHTLAPDVRAAMARAALRIAVKYDDAQLLLRSLRTLRKVDPRQLDLFLSRDDH